MKSRLRAKGVAVVAGLAIVVSACGGAADDPSAEPDDATDDQDEGDPELDETDEGAAADTAGCEEVTARASHHISSASAVHVGLERLAADVLEATDGRVTIEVLSDAQLGGLGEMTENLRSNVVQIALIDTGTLSQFDGEMGVFDLPFMFEDMTEFNDLMDGEVGDLVADRVRAVGPEPLYWSAVGLRSMFFNGVTVTGPDDMAGLTMRVPEAPVWVDTFRALGTSPTAIPAGDLYTSVQTGVVDGFELPHGTTVDLALNEVATDMTISGHILTNILIAASSGFLDSLCDADREAIIAASADAEQVTREGWLSDNEEAEEVLFAELNVVDSPDLEAFRAATESVHEDFRAANGDELYEAVTGALGR
jgi:TRAP-type transport system periplasmic protein